MLTLLIIDRPVTIAHLPLPVDDPRRRRPDISRAQVQLDWHPRVSLAEGLVRTCAWFAEEIGASGLGTELAEAAQ